MTHVDCLTNTRTYPVDPDDHWTALWLVVHIKRTSTTYFVLAIVLPGVLITLPEGCDFDQLRSLVEKRLGVVPEQLFVGSAQVLDAADLREGDLVTVVQGSPDGPEQRSLQQRERPAWYSLLHAVLTLVIFVALSELFQRFVFRPWFQPTTDADASHPGAPRWTPGAGSGPSM